MPERTTAKINGAIDEIKALVATDLLEYIEGEREDLKAFIAEVLTNAADAALIPDVDRQEAVLRELQAQLSAIAEVHRIALSRKARETTATVLHVFVRTLIAVI